MSDLPEAVPDSDPTPPHGIARPDQDARDRLRAEVIPDAVPAPSPEQYLRDRHADSEERLIELRARRDDLNELIRQEVANEDVLRRAVAVFDRARAKQEADGDDPDLPGTG